MVVALVGLAMVAGSLVGAAPRATAADPDTAEVATGPRRTEVLAASGSVVIARAQETASAGFTQWSADGGTTWEQWDTGWDFTPTTAAAYVAAGKAVWIHAVSTANSAVTVVDLTNLGSPSAVVTTSVGRDQPEAATDAQAVVGRGSFQLRDLTGATDDVPIRIDSVTAPKKNTHGRYGWVLQPAGLLRTSAWSKKANGRITYLDIDPVAPGKPGSLAFGPKPFRIKGYVPFVNLYWKSDGTDGLAVIEYLRLSGTSLTWCTREWNTTTDALKKAACKKVAKTKKSATITANRFAPAGLTTPSLAITINGALKLWNGKKLVSVAKLKSHSLSFTGVGDPVAPLVRAERTPAGGIYAADAKGRLTKQFDYFIGRMSPVALDLTHTLLAGLDGRAAYKGWTRAVDDEIAPPVDEVLLSGATAGLQLSGSRSAQRVGTRLTLQDDGATTGTATKVSALADTSGPYSLITRSKKTYVIDSRGAVVAKPSKSGNQIVAIFGSLAVEQSKDRKSILVRELTGNRSFPVASQIPGASAGWRVSKVLIWGDLVVVGTSFRTFRTSYVYSWQLRQWVSVDGSTISAENTVPVAMGDGVAAVHDLTTGFYALWDLDDAYIRGRAGTKPFEDADTSVAPSFDGVGRMVYSTGTALQLVDLSQWDEADLSGQTAPRVLGTVAPTSVEINSVWRLAVDASRPLADGVVEIEDSTGTVVAELETSGGVDGSVRVEWNGAKLDEHGDMFPGDTPDELVLDGVYTWRFLANGMSGGALAPIDGVGRPSGTVKVTTAKLTTATPKISGTAAVGRTLTATHSWKPAGLAYTYEWRAAGVPIAGATAKTYQLTADEAGKAITVSVTATNRRGTVVTKVSKATKKVALGTLTTKTPTIAGTLRVGETLTASPGDWAPAETVFTYQWFRVNSKGKATAIPGARADSYLPEVTDVGSKLRVTVTGQAPGYKTASKASKVTSAKVVA